MIREELWISWVWNGSRRWGIKRQNGVKYWSGGA